MEINVSLHYLVTRTYNFPAASDGPQDKGVTKYESPLEAFETSFVLIENFILT